MGRKLILSLVVASLLAAPSVVGTAHADDESDSAALSFLLSLDEYGVTYATGDKAIAAGNALCGQLRSGMDPWAVRDYWASEFGTTRTAGALIASASRYLCPEQLEILDNQIRNRPPDIG
ncbi:DUF732 domain-containing protein [Mycolicibacterium bacteremicum]|uniref:DUF732 domain-containing protein n=1 Tax=Mycolicibacterium bacteremicum TaxID=564198 RepID=UPI0026F2AA7B|nr:DUF732 domain-containing protein [Mycolicibacterium bacteremicum]